MEAFAYKILQIGEVGSLGLSWVILLMSAVVAVWLTNFQWKFGRAGYVLSTGFVIFLSGMTSFLSLGAADALKDGYLAVLVGAIYGLLIPIGALAGLFAAARSMDAYGKKDRWFWGLIPFMNLFLMFAKPQVPRKLNTARFLGNTAMIIVGILLMASGKASEKIVNETVQQSVQSIQDDPGVQAKAIQYEAENKGLENFLKETAAAIAVPTKIDNATTLKAIQVENSTFRYIYEISTPGAKFGAALNDKVMSNWCKSDNFKPFWDVGATIVGRYLDMSGNTLIEISANPSLCASWKQKLDAELSASALSLKGPIKVDDVTSLTSASYDPGTFSYHYTISVTPTDETWKAYVKTNWCKSPDMKQMMDAGLNVRGVYVSESGAPIGEVIINKATCSAT